MGNQESEPSPLNPACLRAGSDMEDNAEKSYLQAKKLLLMIDLLWEIQKPVTPSQFHAEFCKMSRKKSYVKLYEEHAILDLDDIAKDNEWFTSWYTKPETESVQKWIKDELYLKIINDNHLQHLMDGIDQWYSKEVVMKKLTDVMLTTPQQPVGIVHHEDTECLQQKPQHDSSTIKNINSYEKQEEARTQIMQSNNLIDAFKRELLENNRVSNILQNQTLHNSIENKKLRDRVKKLENDIKLMNTTSADTKNSATVFNFLSSLAINSENVTLLEKNSLQRWHRIKELERILENLVKSNFSLIQTAAQQASNNEELRAVDKEKIRNLMEKNQNLLKELEKTKSAALNIHNNAIKNCSQCSKNVEEVESMRMTNQLLETKLGQCTEEIEGLKITIARKEKEIDAKKNDIDGLERSKSTNHLDKIRSIDEQRVEKLATEKEKKITRAPTATVDAENKKYIVVEDDWGIDIWKDTVEHINASNTNNLSNLSQNLSLYHKEMFVIIGDIVLEKDKKLMDKLLPICRSWKKLRPDGEIHVIAWRYSLSVKFPAELESFFTTFNTFKTCYNKSGPFPKTISKYWPKYADQLLLPEYLNF